MDAHPEYDSTPLDKEPVDPNIPYEEGSICKISPFVRTILPDCVHLHCYRYALNPHPTKARRCAGCQYAHYCFKECQATDRKDRHKVECKIVAHKLITGPPKFLLDTTILMFAVIARLAKELESGTEAGNLSFFGLPVNMDKALVDMVNSMGALLQHKDLFNICDPKKLYTTSYTEVGLRNFTFICGAVMQTAGR
ncbi:hypothetical protein RvY_06049-1 [Ramazzottius varieornatus]|uniref:MYND-type domain-containing protein n=1 Tax=Ramazzottius varieornatus TaxID=947166 RepID=A0A1D1V3N0_RAMVA|nr:hypothetical protein RvY_06049-1 [Ramazzottius varieornatus]